MRAAKLSAPPEDIRTEWRRLNDAIDDIAAGQRVVSAQPHLVHVDVTEGGLVFDFTGLINALASKGINLTTL
jgi:hypothetical protein